MKYKPEKKGNGHLMVNILDGLVILAVHVENVQERLVDMLVTLEPALLYKGRQSRRGSMHTYIIAFYMMIDQPMFYTFILFTKLMASTKSTGFFSSCSLIAKPLGKKVLNPRISSGYPLKRVFTRIITPFVSILHP